ncbi:hypothetical protein CLV72_104322 [Allonocardiopsis opalescens]|uniref:Uncharacterized protein n=1 Tax=Allonocardiopsis opalescens TaxID=1144618 RepID=A0A2T0Q4P8_9ACTN|nr:hypothetical protein CLV72_104322 [Allonocardiopsis opalescens]
MTRPAARPPIPAADAAGIFSAPGPEGHPWS